MDANSIAQNHPVNFFMAGGKYISDKINIQIIDTASPNAFDNLDLTTINPDMMDEYINSEKVPELKLPEEKGVLESIVSFFK